jgi:hypothetical protein
MTFSFSPPLITPTPAATMPAACRHARYASHTPCHEERYAMSRHLLTLYAITPIRRYHFPFLLRFHFADINS